MSRPLHNNGKKPIAEISSGSVTIPIYASPVAQGDHMTPGTEGPGLLIDSRVARHLRHQVRRNVVEELTQNGEF